MNLSKSYWSQTKSVNRLIWAEAQLVDMTLTCMHEAGLGSFGPAYHIPKIPYTPYRFSQNSPKQLTCNKNISSWTSERKTLEKCRNGTSRGQSSVCFLNLLFKFVSFYRILMQTFNYVILHVLNRGTNLHLPITFILCTSLEKRDKTWILLEATTQKHRK